jgi:hypothetical protein
VWHHLIKSLTRKVITAPDLEIQFGKERKESSWRKLMA